MFVKHLFSYTKLVEYNAFSIHIILEQCEHVGHDS
jgi:hypothetical protein